MVSGIYGGFASPSDWSQLAPNAGSAQPPSDADIKKRMSSAEDRMSKELFGNGDYRKYKPFGEGFMINY